MTYIADTPVSRSRPDNCKQTGEIINHRDVYKRQCYQEQYTNGSKAKRVLLPVRHLQQWIEHNILLELASAPFSKEDAALVPEAGACLDCPKRTGHNKLLFADMGTGQKDSCSDPKCYACLLYTSRCV